MIYVDTSCLLKLLFVEPESAAVRAAIDAEEALVISSLTALETEVQLKAAFAGGKIRLSQWRQHQVKLTQLRNIDPFQYRPLSGSVFTTALEQHTRPESPHCRTLDRLHLAAIEELSISRLMTLDKAQGKVAEALGIRVVYPGQNLRKFPLS
jgi:predicted nucleic acid-binding protein